MSPPIGDGDGNGEENEDGEAIVDKETPDDGLSISTEQFYYIIIGLLCILCITLNLCVCFVVRWKKRELEEETKRFELEMAERLSIPKIMQLGASQSSIGSNIIIGTGGTTTTNSSNTSATNRHSSASHRQKSGEELSEGVKSPQLAMAAALGEYDDDDDDDVLPATHMITSHFKGAPKKNKKKLLLNFSKKWKCALTKIDRE